MVIFILLLEAAELELVRVSSQGFLTNTEGFFHWHDMNYHEENQVSGPCAGGIFPSLLGKLLLYQVAGQ